MLGVERVVTVREEALGKETGGCYGAESVVFTAPANQTTDYVRTVPIDISLLAAQLDCKDVNDGDQMMFLIGEDTIIGTTPSAVGAGVTTIPVPQSVIDMMGVTIWPGYLLKITEGGTTDDLGMITGWDDVGLTLTVQTATINSFSTGSLLKVTVSLNPRVFTTSGCMEVTQGDNKIFQLGDSKIGGSRIDKGKSVTIRYVNNDALNAVKVDLMLEYLY